MRKGRTGRQRRAHNWREVQQSCSKADVCADLRKWMVLRSSRSDLSSTFQLVPFDFPETGRGLKTKVAITPGTVILSIPQCLLLTPSTVLRSDIGPLVKRWRCSFTPHQLLALFLLVEHNRGSNSEWHLFLSSLPIEYTLPHYFSDEELNALPLHVSLTAQRIIQRSHHVHKQVLRFCTSHWRDAENWACWERFRWAWCTVSSRAVFLETEEGTQQFLDLSMKDENSVALCPYLDLLNHNSTARVRAGLNQQNGTYEIISDDAYLPHEQVFISYGPHDNTKLFLLYGFILPNNVHNSVCFSVDDFVKLRELFDVACWDQKLAALRKHELHRDLSCTTEGVSWNLMSALKILSMNWEQLQKSERVVTGEALPPSVESSARYMARHLIGQALAKGQTLLAKQPADREVSVHGAIASRLVQEEVDILTVALRDVT